MNHGSASIVRMNSQQGWSTGHACTARAELRKHYVPVWGSWESIVGTR